MQPIRGEGGKNVCPVCQNTGQPVPYALPVPQARVGSPTVPATTPGPATPAATPPGRQQAPGAVASLVCGIIGAVTGLLGLVLGPIAIWQSSVARRAMAGAPGRYDGEGMATAGRVLGIVALVIGALTILVAALVFASVARLGALINDAPDMAFSTDEGNDRITVVEVQGGVTWEDFEVGGSAGCVLPSGQVDVGDVLQCDGPGTAWLRHTTSRTLVYETSFAD